MAPSGPGGPESGDARTVESATVEGATDDLDRRSLAIGLTVVLVAVGAVRLLPMVSHDWALGDGGLFFSMIGDLIRAGFALPDVASYQGGVIPFAYPPLAFYLAATVEEATGLARIDVLRALPWLLSVLTVPAMYLLAAEIGPSRRHALVAAAFFGAATGLTVVLTGGGGLTRSAGLLLALLATWMGLRMLRTGRGLDIVATAVLSGLAVLAHPQAGPFVGIALGAAWLTRWRTRRAFAQLLLAALAAFAVISPWLATVITRHGVEPFRAAAGVPGRDLGDSLIAYLFLFLLTVPAIGLFDLLGQVQQALARRPQLLAWRVGVFTLDLRFSPISGAAPVSMLAAHGVLDVLVPATWRLLTRAGRPPARRERSISRRAVVTAALAVGFVPSVGAMLEASGPAGAISPAQREAMSWVREMTSPDTVTVSLASSGWGSDDVSEWFPALSQRASATTSQGLEWSGQVHRDQLAAESELQDCRAASTDLAACVSAWVERHAQGAEIVVYLDRSATDARRFDDLASDLVGIYGYSTAWSSDEGLILRAPSQAAGLHA